MGGMWGPWCGPCETYGRFCCCKACPYSRGEYYRTSYCQRHNPNPSKPIIFRIFKWIKKVFL